MKSFTCGFCCCTHTCSEPLTTGLSPSLKMHSTSCAFSSSYDESYCEWSSFCSYVEYNSCKNMISAVSTSKGGNQAYIRKDLLRDEFCFSFIQLETILDHTVARSWRQLFNFQPCFLSLLFLLNFKKLSKINIIYIWHNYLADPFKI